MKPFMRVLSGGLFGAALLTGLALATPRSAMADGPGFCDETENYVCCCTTNSANELIGCKCQLKPSQPEMPMA